MVRPTWDTEDFPVLKWLAEREDESAEPIVVRSTAVASALGLEHKRVVRAMDSLYDAGYIGGEIAHAMDEAVLMAGHLTERGRRQVGQWPAEAYDALISAIESLIEKEADPERKSRLRALLDGVVGAGRDIAVSILTEWAKRQSGL